MIEQDYEKMMVYKARAFFQQAQRKGMVRRIFAALTGRSNRLMDLSTLESQGHAYSQHYAGIRTVSISKIQGSEGRTKDFDRNFNPLSGRSLDRFTSIFVARQQDVPLPPVDLIQVGDVYFVRDGHHRLSVARAVGATEVDAEVTEFRLANCASGNRVNDCFCLEAQAA